VLLVFITYALIVLVDRPNAADVVVRRSDHKSNPGRGLASGGVSAGHSPGTATVHIEAVGHSIALTTGEFLVGSCIVLIAMIGASVLLGWLAAGRVLRPLRIMTATARQISERHLHEPSATPSTRSSPVSIARSTPSNASSPTPPTSCAPRSCSARHCSKSRWPIRG
jgi:hypothetical protein